MVFRITPPQQFPFVFTALEASASRRLELAAAGGTKRCGRRSLDRSSDLTGIFHMLCDSRNIRRHLLILLVGRCGPNDQLGSVR